MTSGGGLRIVVGSDRHGNNDQALVPAWRKRGWGRAPGQDRAGFLKVHCYPALIRPFHSAPTREPPRIEKCSQRVGHTHGFPFTHPGQEEGRPVGPVSISEL